MDLYFLADVSECVSNGYVSPRKYWIDIVVATISAGILLFLFQYDDRRQTKMASIAENDFKFMEDMNNHFSYDSISEDGIRLYGKPLHKFCEETLDTFVYRMFKKYLSYEITFEFFEARIQRIYGNLGTENRFSDNKEATLRDAISNTTKNPINDKTKYYDFLDNVLAARSEREVRKLIFNLDYSPKRFLFNYRFCR